MPLIVLALLFYLLSACGPQTVSPSSTPAHLVTEQPAPKITAPAPLITAAPSFTPYPSPSPTSFPLPSPETPKTPVEDEQQPVAEITASPAPPPVTPVPPPAAAVRLSADVPAAYQGKVSPYPWNEAGATGAGKTVFISYCRGCHGETGNLQPNANFTSPAVSAKIREEPAYFFWRVSEGKKTASGFNMPAFKDLLKEEERWQAIIYIQSLGSQ